MEWDDKTRGKHDGSCVDESGTSYRYFKCDYGAGSFIRGNKLNKGRSLVEALRDRYVDINAPSILAENSTALPDGFFTTSKGNQKSIEFVGEKKIREKQQLHNIEKVSVRTDYVSSMGDELSTIASHLVELDLQDNLLSQWEEIHAVGLAMPGLTTLLLHGNKMLSLNSTLVDLFNSSGSLRQLQVLALNNCNIQSIAEVMLLDRFLPNLEELYLSGNNLSDLPQENALEIENNQVREEVPFIQGFNKLRTLDISNCGIREWHQVQLFGKLLVLKELILDVNPLESINPPVNDTFLELNRISLGGTSISLWSDIDNLAAYPAISVMRLSQVPLFSGKGPSEVRPLVIARIERLSVLNGSIINPRERRDSEKGYLRSIFNEKARLCPAGSDSAKETEVEADLTTRHPRYLQLKSLYENELLPYGSGAANANQSSTLASEMLSIRFNNLVINAQTTPASLEPVVKRLPGSLTITRLKTLISQLYHVPPAEQYICLRLYKDSIPIELDDESATLSYYGAIDGADLFINELSMK